jgi:hypothetical protein
MYTMRPLFFISLFLVFAGCSHSNNYQLPPHGVLENGLTEKLNKNFTSDWLTDCDSRYRSTEEEIANVLDDNFAEIKSLTEKPVESGDFNRFQLGSLWMWERKQKEPAIDKWVEGTYSWDNIYKYYTKIKDTPINQNWVYLYSDAQYLLSIDWLRLIDYTNSELDKDSLPLLNEALIPLRNCYQDSTCFEPKMSEKVEQFLTQNRIYNWLLEQVKESEDRSQKRERFEILYKRMVNDASDYVFIQSKYVKRLSKSDYEISLNSGDLRGNENEISKRILPVWTSDQYKVRIKWVDHVSSDPAITFKISQSVAGRSWTRVDLGEIELAQNSRISTLPHEFGHGLGFRDHYFDVWKSDQCLYVDQYNNGDIMSNDTTGQVTPSDWAELDSAYPVTPAQK